MPGIAQLLSDRALRENREGRAGFRIKVSTEGVPQSCEITESSGSNDLDATTCTLIMRRGRFIPGTDQEGNPAEGWWASAVRWNIPAPPPPSTAPVTCVAGKICERN